MALTAGTRLGPYEVTAQIGVGGMGEVFRARDTTRNSVFSPDGQWIAFWADGELKRAGVTGGTPSTICRDVANPYGISWGDDGVVVAQSGGTGAPVSLIEFVGMPAGGAGPVHLAMARNGTLVYVGGTSAATGNRTLVWVDRTGREEPIAVPPRAYTYARLSPDGRQVALDSRDEQNERHLDVRSRARHARPSDPRSGDV